MPSTLATLRADLPAPVLLMLLLLLPLLARVHALPSNSPVCNVNTAQAALGTSGMTPLTQLPPTTYTFTASSQTYTPGMAITLTMTGPSYRGILAYTSTAASATVQVGTWAIPTNMQNNANVCTNSDNPNSSITHTQITGNYTTTTFTYTAPTTNVGDLHVNFILVQVGAAGYAYQITPCAVIIKAATAVTTPAAATTPLAIKTTTPMANAATPATASCSTVVQTTTMTSTTMVRVTTTVTTIRTLTVTPAASASKCLAAATPNAMTTTKSSVVAATTTNKVVSVTQCCLGDKATTTTALH
ncbi:hypothetical protein HDU83_002681 [Entophlyctis luteolus]|nr:hypothetical protein HDU83_002681 [Entophlyctis luteolus]KAJ3389234.1 hypothetical protein HDU84_008972 [Entophlyctis sp. JEL0112]